MQKQENLFMHLLKNGSTRLLVVKWRIETVKKFFLYAVDPA